MKNIQGIQLIMESNEELLPDFFMDFPYICSCVEFDKYIDPVVPWHWHHAVELFYIKSGRVEYTTPNGKWIFPAGTGGFVNSNVLHSSRVVLQRMEPCNYCICLIRNCCQAGYLIE